MTTLAKHIIVVGAENHPPMLEKSVYDSWASRIRLFIKGEKHDRMILDSIDNATNITLHDLLPNVYALVNHQEAVKDIWDRYYWRFSQLINDMHTIGMTMQQVLVNNKFLNAVPSEWSKFVTDVNLVVPTFQQGEDPIECINKAMAFLSIVASWFPPSNNQLRTSSNPINQATIQDGRVIVQKVQGRQTQSYAGIGNRGMATTSKGNFAAGQPRVVKCYNCQGEGHMARQLGQILDKEQLVFLADPGISEASVALQTIPKNLVFQTKDLDAYDSDCDDLSSAKAVLMENLSSCDPEVLFKVPYSDSYLNDMINQDVQEMQYSEQTHINDFQDNEIHSDSNTILYSQYLQESQDAVIQDTNSSAPNDLLVLSLVEQMTDHVAHLDKENKINKMINESLTADLERYKERMYRSTQAMHMLTKPQVFYDDTYKQALGYQNLFHLKKAQRIQPTLYDGSVIAKEHAMIFMIDDVETLILEEESRSKMLDKQNDPISIEKKIKISLIDYSKLNKIKEDFGKRFVTKKELSAEQAFWLKHYSFSETPITSHTPARIEAPSKLPKDTFNAFDKTLLDEITEVQTVFNLMEAAADQCSVDKNVFEILIKQLRIDNDHLLN
ncbi:retrovirus-related pol polyprotein from transposon TNT 1-94 [Tanacetum coccineum]